MKRILAIDPGSISGAAAILDELGAAVFDLPVVDNDLDLPEMLRLFRAAEANVAVVERVGSMPGQGVSSTFKFGTAFGAIKCAVAAAGLPLILVPPAKWKGHFRLAGKDKEGARSLAIQRFPGVQGLSRKKDHGRAEALLLGLWFRETR